MDPSPGVSLILHEPVRRLGFSLYCASHLLANLIHFSTVTCLRQQRAKSLVLCTCIVWVVVILLRPGSLYPYFIAIRTTILVFLLLYIF